MKTDRELLELAAKAAGVDLWGKTYMDGNYFYGDNRRWAPLTDDGHALRLAVKLKLCFGPNFDGDLAVCFGDNGENVTEGFGADPYAATRRVIVRAAAELGSQS